MRQGEAPGDEQPQRQARESKRKERDPRGPGAAAPCGGLAGGAGEPARRLRLWAEKRKCRHADGRTLSSRMLGARGRYWSRDEQF